jgi:hypothetical protein
MKWNRGLFRLWVVLTLLWVLRGLWVWWPDLVSDCSDTFRRNFERQFEVLCAVDELPDNANVPFWQTAIWYNRVHTVELIAFPPITLFLLSYAAIWVVSGFRRENSK